MNPYYIHPELQVGDYSECDQNSPEYKFWYMNRDKGLVHRIHFFTKKEKMLELPNGGHYNPYHLMVYMISRFYFFDDGHTPIHYYYPCTDTYICNKVLEHLPPRFIRHTVKDDEKEYVQLPIGKWHANGETENKWLFSYLRSLFQGIVKDTLKIKGKGIYISRKKATNRCIVNEDEFKDQLKMIGFSYILLEDFTFEEQARLFASSSVITGPHGAGFAWLLFCQPNTHFLEVREEKNFSTNHYFELSNQLNLNYLAFDAERVEGENNQLPNLRVDAKKYINLLKLLNQ